MPLTQLDPLAASLFSAIAIASLLLAFVMLAFVMLGSRWLDNYLYAFVLAAVACLGVLVRYLLSQFGTGSTAELKRLVV